jgi:hypothetical protein
VTTVYGRTDSGFYCWEAVQAYEKRNWRFIVVARKTAQLVDELKAVHAARISGRQAAANAIAPQVSYDQHHEH